MLFTTSRQLHLADTFRINTSLLQPTPSHIQVINATVTASQRKNMFLESEVENKPSVHRNNSQLVHYDSSTFEHSEYNKFVHREHDKSVHRKHEVSVHREHDKSVHRNYKEFEHRKQSQLVDTSADYGKPIKNKCQVKEKIYYIFFYKTSETTARVFSLTSMTSLRL